MFPKLAAIAYPNTVTSSAVLKAELSSSS